MSESPRPTTASVANPKRTRIDSLEQLTKADTAAEQPETTNAA